jgi:hypothetical protein
MSEWISVKDRMPDPEVAVLVHCMCRDPKTKPGEPPARISVIGVTHSDKAGWWPGVIERGGVLTHWMPLPEPPEEGACS